VIRTNRGVVPAALRVENPNKPGKIRLVFDTEAKAKDVSLNSALMKGPQRYKPLPAVLFHFREGEVGVCADIKEMFHQVLMQPQDRCSQRFQTASRHV